MDLLPKGVITDNNVIKATFPTGESLPVESSLVLVSTIESGLFVEPVYIQENTGWKVS